MSNYDLDYGNIVTDNILSAPFTHYIDKLAERDGYDSSDLRRKMFATGGSAFMGAFGSIVAGPLGFIMGLMGYAAGMAVRFDDEGQDDELMDAAIRAIKKARYEIPDHIVEQIYDAIMEYQEVNDVRNYSSKKSLKVIYSIMADIDRRAANLWVVYLKNEL